MTASASPFNALELCHFPGPVSQAVLSPKPVSLFAWGSVGKVGLCQLPASQRKGQQQGSPAAHGSPVALFLCQAGELNQL